jgi:hypothetical protein
VVHWRNPACDTRGMPRIQEAAPGKRLSAASFAIRQRCADDNLGLVHCGSSLDFLNPRRQGPDSRIHFMGSRPRTNSTPIRAASPRATSAHALFKSPFAGSFTYCGNSPKPWSGRARACLRVVNLYSAAVEALANSMTSRHARREASKAFGLYQDCKRVHLKIVL